MRFENNEEEIKRDITEGIHFVCSRRRVVVMAGQGL